MSQSASGSSSDPSIVPTSPPPPPPMELVGPETPQQQALREWFEQQVGNNMAQIEEGARQINQLVTAMFGVMFAVLVFGDSPDFLKLGLVKGLGSATIFAYGVALLASLDALYPWARRIKKITSLICVEPTTRFWHAKPVH